MDEGFFLESVTSIWWNRYSVPSLIQGDRPLFGPHSCLTFLFYAIWVVVCFSRHPVNMEDRLWSQLKEWAFGLQSCLQCYLAPMLVKARGGLKVTGLQLKIGFCVLQVLCGEGSGSHKLTLYKGEHTRAKTAYPCNSASMVNIHRRCQEGHPGACEGSWPRWALLIECGGHRHIIFKHTYAHAHK